MPNCKDTNQSNPEPLLSSNPWSEKIRQVKGTTQFNSVVAKLQRSDYGGFCDDLLIAQTFVLVVGSSGGVQFNEAQAFTLFYDGSAQLYQLQVPAATGTALPVSLAGAAVLPSSRSVQVCTTATAFATVIATGAGTASACVIAPQTSVPAAFSFQTTDPATNALTGSPNTPVDIGGGALQSFMIAFTPSAAFDPTDVRLTFDCTNTNPVASIAGVNTLLLSGSSSAVPDIIALAATFGNDGIVNIPGASGTGAFAVASVNVGAAGSMTVAPDTGGRSLAVQLTLCQTNPATGACLAPPTGSVATQINGMETPTFAIFVRGTGTVSFNPGTNRIFLRFKDAGAVTRGATSVAVRTQ